MTNGERREVRDKKVAKNIEERTTNRNLIVTKKK